MSIPRFAKVATLLLAVLFIVSCRGLVDSPAPTPKASDAPTILMVAPQTNGVGINRAVAVVFSKAMDPSSINASSFLVAGVTGTVSYDATNMIAAFKPSSALAPNTTYSATITTAARDLSGTPLAAAFGFTFLTRSTPDTSAPDVVAVNVAAGAKCVALDQKIQIVFDEAMDSLTINSSTVFIGGVTGAVSYNAGSQTATITPSAALAANTTYTINVTTGAKDLGSVPLSSAFTQTFTTGPCQNGGVAPVALCPFIGDFAVLAGSTVTNTGSTTITGDVGVSPGTAITGFPPGLASGTFHSADDAAGKAQIALTAAYVDAATRTGSTSIAGDLVGRTFTAGVYKSTSSLELSGDVTLDAQGNPDAVFIFQIGSTLTTASGSHVILANGAKACNVFWQVGSSATLGTYSVFKGNILALTSITVTTGVNLQGRALARNGAVTLDTDVITGCTCQ